MIHRFGSVTVDDATREVRRGEQALHPQPRHLDVLLYLIRHRERIVPRGELHDQFWPEVEWPEHAIESCLAGARRLLRGSTATIRSAYGRGVRFVGPRAAGASLAAPATSLPSELLGRRDEVARLCAATADLLAGHGGVALIAGEPGIGKTRLAEELARHARLRGAETLIAVCRDEAAPFDPWRQLLESYAATRDARDLRATFGDRISALGSIAPALGGDASGRTVGAPADPARSALVEALAGFLGGAATRHPLVLVFEDLHWADSSSLFLLQSVVPLVAEDRILVVATHRDPDGDASASLRAALAALQGSPRVMRLVPGPLADVDAGALLALVSGGSASAAVAAAIVAKAEGNPFFLTEYWRHQQASLPADARQQEMGVRGDAEPLPPTIGALMGSRLGRLSPPCRAVLDVAAVIGREFDDGLLAAICDLPSSALLDALDEAVQQRIAIPVRGATNRYRFAHALMRDAVYGRLLKSRRCDLHQRIATWLEARSSGDLDAAAADLSHHFRAGGDAEKAIAYAIRAGELARAMLAYEGAARYFELALATLEAQRPSLVLHRYDLLVALGEAYASAGDATRAAAAYARADADRGVPFLPEAGRQTPLVAADVATPGPHAHFVARLELFLRLTDEPLAGESWHDVRRRREAHAQTALAHARRGGDRSALAAALLQRRWMAQGPRFAADRLALSTELVEVAEDIGAIDLAQEGRLFRIGDLLERGRAEAAHAAIDGYARMAQRRPEPLYVWGVAYLRAMQAQTACRFDEAEELAQRALTLGAPALGELAHAVFGMQIGTIRAWQGRMTELADVIEFVARNRPEQVVMQTSLIRLNCMRGRMDEARAQLEAIAAADFAAIDTRPVTWMNAASGLAESCAALGDRVRAAQLYRRLRPMTGRCAMGPIAIGFLGAVDGYLGVLAGAMRRWSDAATHFETALALNGRMGSPGAVAAAQLAYARMLLDKGGRGAAGRARELLDAAAAACRTLNMPGILAEVESLLQAAR